MIAAVRGAVSRPRLAAMDLPDDVRRWLRLGLLGSYVLVAALSLPIALFGVGQFVGTLTGQLAGPAHVTDFLALYSGGTLLVHDPARLYDVTAALDIQRRLQGDTLPRELPFWNPPHAALLFAPLSLLPYGAAYAVWAGINIGSLALAAYLLAPRLERYPRWSWLAWLPLGALFLPAQLGLIMGQTSSLMLLGYCFFARRLLGARRVPGTGWALGLLPWTLKPQLLPPAVLALAFARGWRGILLLGAIPTALAAAVVAAGGLSMVEDYRAAAALKSGLVFQRAPTFDPGQTFFGLGQVLLGPGQAAVVWAVLAGGLTWGIVAMLWRGGLADDRTRRLLQLAVLPIAMTTSAPYGRAYEMTTWLASAWLLVELVRLLPAARGAVGWALVAGWAAGNAAVLAEPSAGVAWGALGGTLLLATLAWLARQHTRVPGATRPPQPAR